MSDEDLVKRLRERVALTSKPWATTPAMCAEAADAIERLTRERDEAREQLRLANIDCFNAEAESKEMRDVAVEMRDTATAFVFRAEAAERKVEKLREALVGLNAAIDNFWNDSSRPAIHTFSARGIEEWQIKSRAALAETEEVHLNRGDNEDFLSK